MRPRQEPFEDENVDALIVVLAAVSWAASDVEVFKSLGEMYGSWQAFPIRITSRRVPGV